MEILGIDIGGTGVKGALVNTSTGELLTDRLRLPTPQPSKPARVAKVVTQMAAHFGWVGPIGCGFPAVVMNGTAYSAANIHENWIGTNVEDLLANATGCPVRVVNDADAAGFAEMSFGAGRGHDGSVIIITIGTGLGTALFRGGVLFPNAELGHIEINGMDAEKQASDAARKQLALSWKKWAVHFNKYLMTLEALLSPDLFILGGGSSKKFEKYAKYLTVRAEVVPAQMLNEAGIVGAAIAARELAEN